MKYLNKFWLGVLTLVTLVSCEDYLSPEYLVEKPARLEALEYLNDYDVLKNYVNRSVNADFKLGAGVSLSDFNKQGLIYSHAVSNFDELTAGWAMKHGAVVQADGSLDLSKVEKFVKTAKEGGLSVYGHTLAWHSNQNADYLYSTIAPTIIPGAGGPAWESIGENNFEGDEASNYEYSTGAEVSFTADGDGADGKGRALKITNSEVRENDWNVQFFLSLEETMVEGQSYRISVDVKADDAVSFGTQAHVVPYEYKHWQFFGSINATSQWNTFVAEIVCDGSVAGTGALALNLGSNATTYYLDNLSIEWLNPVGGGGPAWDVASANDFETDDASNYEGSTSAVLGFTGNGEGAAGKGRALTVTNTEVYDSDWKCQYFFTFPTPTVQGQQFTLSMDVKADDACSIATQAHTTPGAYKHWNFFGSINVTTEWSNFSKEVTIVNETSECTTIAINLGSTATKYYFDNIKVSWFNEDSGGKTIVEMTAEEKRDTIYSELDRWISGALAVSKEYVKAWDVVNEPMDDASPYELKSGLGKEPDSDHFYWQDYLGKDYAAEAFKMARANGNADDKLFINDYNLAYNIDKCKGLIQYVEYIESKEVVVDGIGTQMHVNINSDKDNITEMFTLLAATGKLIKISELDVGLDGVKTADATEEQYIAQEEMYKFIVKQYLSIIPASQQYGITFWSLTDSPEGSGWRPGEPVGLWTESYYRKRAYAGVVDALSGN